MLPLLLYDEGEDLDDKGLIKVHLDNTDYVKAYYAKIVIRNAYKKAFGNEMVRCGLNTEVGNAPFVFENFDKKTFDFKPTIATAFVLG